MTTRNEADREHYQDLREWAQDHAPELLPEDGDDPDPAEWRAVWAAIEAAKHSAEWAARNPGPHDFSYREGDPF